MYESLFLLLVIVFFIVAWQNRSQAVLLVLAALPSYLLRLNIGGIPITFLEVMILVTTILWLVQDRGWKTLRTLPPAWDAFIMLFLAVATVSAFAAPSLQSAFGAWKAYMIEPVIFFFLARGLLNTAELRRQAVLYLTIGATFVSLYAIVQHLFGLGIPEPWDVEGRTTSIFPYPNAVGLYVGPILVLVVGALIKTIQTRRLIRAIGYAASVVICASAVIFSQSEAVWVAVPAAVFVGLLFFRRVRLAAIGVAFALAVVLLALPSIRTPVLEKLTLQDYSGGVRLAQWEETVSMLKDNWLFGAGLSGYPSVIAPYHTHPEIEIFQYPHNIFLNVWTELGALGVLILVLITAAVISTLARATRHKTEEFALTVFSAAALLEMVVHGLVDAPYFKNDLSVLTWGILALFLLAANRAYADKTSR